AGHELSRLLTDLTALAEIATQEDFLLGIADRHRADGIAHPELHYHPARHCRRTLDVVARTGGDLLRAEDHLFRHPAPEQHHQPAEQIIATVGVAVLLWHRRGDPQRPAPRDDGHLMDRIEPR